MGQVNHWKDPISKMQNNLKMGSFQSFTCTGTEAGDWLVGF